jgi:ribose 1,5-bisphosphate isomerase
MDDHDVQTLRESVIETSREFAHRLDRAQEDRGRVGANRLQDGDVVMFYCHSTDAMACIERAAMQNKDNEAIVKETRPRNLGHITAEQLRDLGYLE